MRYRRLLFAVFFLVFFTLGCSATQEFAKTVWGSSTRALEEARAEALSKTFRCTYENCYTEILNIISEKGYTVFMDNQEKKVIVVMSVPGSVDTTEVGIFLSAQNSIASRQTKVEVTSLSSNAKITVATALFEELEKIFKEV